jgi:hypothetical protein
MLSACKREEYYSSTAEPRVEALLAEQEGSRASGPTMECSHQEQQECKGYEIKLQ